KVEDAKVEDKSNLSDIILRIAYNKNGNVFVIPTFTNKGPGKIDNGDYISAMLDYNQASGICENITTGARVLNLDEYKTLFKSKDFYSKFGLKLAFWINDNFLLTNYNDKLVPKRATSSSVGNVVCYIPGKI
ncbi:hypothetical protein, partial [Aliivibrio fischeri]|uniref:hypothetical protein n=1 Tax=Aliivibrio fischeri TaxID=668 RepID=UPI00159EF5B6